MNDWIAITLCCCNQGFTAIIFFFNKIWVYLFLACLIFPLFFRHKHQSGKKLGIENTVASWQQPWSAWSHSLQPQNSACLPIGASQLWNPPCICERDIWPKWPSRYLNLLLKNNPRLIIGFSTNYQCHKVNICLFQNVHATGRMTLHSWLSIISMPRIHHFQHFHSDCIPICIGNRWIWANFFFIKSCLFPQA